MQFVAVELHRLKALAVCEGWRDLSFQGVPTDIKMAEVEKATELRWQGTGQAVSWQMEPSQVGEVAELRCDAAKKVEPREVQCRDPATAQAPTATFHTTPSAYRNGMVAP